jgi:hypothetical protein
MLRQKGDLPAVEQVVQLHAFEEGLEKSIVVNKFVFLLWLLALLDGWMVVCVMMMCNVVQ